MKLSKILDSNILIYSLLDGHPASKACEELILSSEDKFEWVTSPITFIETFHVLVKIYGQDPIAILQKIEQTLKLPLIIIPLDEKLAVISLKNAVKHQLDVNDSILLQIGFDYGISIIATDDKKLIKASHLSGLTCDNPITEEIRKEMAEWERKNLPEKGFSRLYSKVHQWILSKNKDLANQFKSETKSFTRQV